MWLCGFSHLVPVVSSPDIVSSQPLFPLCADQLGDCWTTPGNDDQVCADRHSSNAQLRHNYNYYGKHELHPYVTTIP